MPKGKLLKALDAHQGRNYKLEKQQKQQKQAAKKKSSKTPQSNNEEKENVQSSADGKPLQLEEESEGWESDESDVAEPTIVWRRTRCNIGDLLIHYTDRYISPSPQRK